MNRISNIALGSVLVGLAVLALKFAAYWLTGSVALYSDAMESIVNVAAAFAAFVAVRYAAKPADQNHPYGHHKAEYLAAVLEGVLIVLAAIAIFYQAWEAFLSPRVFEQPVQGLVVNGLAGVLNFAWARYLILSGRRFRSPALDADGRHLMTDVWSSVGVIGGVALAAWTGWMILDPLLAAVVAVNVLWSGWGLVRHSVGGLMDEAPEQHIRDNIRQIISQRADGALEAHDLRTRRAGQKTFVDFHLVVPGSMSVADSHEICDRIEEALRAEVPGCIITIHVEPEEKAKHSGIVVV